MITSENWDNRGCWPGFFIPVPPTTDKTTTTPAKSANLLAEGQNTRTGEQNKLIAGQNKKMAEMSGLSDRIIQKVHSLFGQSSSGFSFLNPCRDICVLFAQLSASAMFTKSLPHDNQLQKQAAGIASF